MMHQIRIFSKTKTIVGFQLLQPVNSSGFEALVFSYAYPYIRHSRNLPVVEHTYPHVSTPALNHRERVVGVVTIWRYSVVSTPDHFIPNTPGEWSTGANKQQTTDHLVLPTCRTTRGQSDISAHYLRLYNIFYPFLFSDLHSTAIFALPTCWAVLYKTVARQRLVTLNHRLSLLLIPSERRESTFLFASLHPVCLNSELKS